MPTPTVPPTHRDLLEAPVPVGLATIGPSGRPQVTAIWVIIDAEGPDEIIVTSLTGARQKLRNLRDRPQATVFVIDPANQFRTLEIRADVEIEPDPELVTLKKVLAAYGTDLDSFPGEQHDRYTVTLRPARIVANG